MEIGDYVYDVSVRRKSQIIGIEDLSSIGSYPDVYIIQECKTGRESESSRKHLRPWKVNDNNRSNRRGCAGSKPLISGVIHTMRRAQECM